MPDTQQEKEQGKCVMSGTPSSIRVAFVRLKNTKKNACYAGQLLRNERWSQERLIFDGPTKIETYHFNLQNVT